jgi:hypothetical protein
VQCKDFCSELAVAQSLQDYGQSLRESMQAEFISLPSSAGILQTECGASLKQFYHLLNVEYSLELKC